MAGVNPAETNPVGINPAGMPRQLNPSLGAQLRTVGMVRWRLFVNSLRSTRGRLNLVSRGIAALLVLSAGLGGAILLAVVSWGMTREHQLRWLAVPFWLICLFWQLFPLMATAFTQNIDASMLLRFPLSYPGYFLVRFIYGTLDIPSGVGLSWCLGLLVGISAANPALAPWALLGVGSFVLFNLSLARMVFVWIEHWLSTRRSREIMGVLFLMTIMGFQVLGPILNRYSGLPMRQRFIALTKLIPLVVTLPPGQAAGIITEAADNQHVVALLSLIVVAGYSLIALLILHVRLHAQYRGEITSAGEKRRSTIAADAKLRHGWRIPLLNGAVSAVYEKELRYFSRSGPMLFTLIMPVIMVFILWGGRRALMGAQMNFVFPIGAAYCLLVLTNIVYNSFGGDGGGVQFFLFSPISLRQVTAAKNLAQLTVLVLDLSILWLGIRLVFQPPRFHIVALTAAWLLFAIPLNFAVGNLLSVYSPKRIDYAVFGRQRASESTILISLAVQLALVGMGIFSLFVAHLYHTMWAGTIALAVLAIPSLITYFVSLARIPGIALRRRDVLTGELCKA